MISLSGPIRQLQEPRFHFFVLEILTGGELFDDIVARGFYSEACASKCLQQVFEALTYCHRNRR